MSESKKTITVAQFADLVHQFKCLWEAADQQGIEGHRTEHALRNVLADLDIKVAREWQDGDAVRSLHVGKDKVLIWIRREGRWYMFSNESEKPTERRSDDDINRYHREGLIKVVSP